jgi:hypothetical protein
LVRALTVTAPAKPPEHNPGMTPTSSPRRRLWGLRRLAFELVRRPHCRRQGGGLSPSRARIRHPSHQGAAGSLRLVGIGTPPTRVRWEGSRLLGGPSALPPIFPGCSPSRGRSGAPCAPSAPVPAVRSARSSPSPRRAQPFTGQPRPGEKGHAPRGIPPPFSYLRDPEPKAERGDHAPATARVFCLDPTRRCRGPPVAALVAGNDNRTPKGRSLRAR